MSPESGGIGLNMTSSWNSFFNKIVSIEIFRIFPLAFIYAQSFKSSSK